MKAWAIPNSAQRLTAVVAVATLYVVTGKLGFLAAIPPGNVTAIWLPSGIVLAAVLLLGNRVWPGVWLGAFLLNTWFFIGLAKPLSIVLLALSASIAVGSTLQALLGAFLIHRSIGSRGVFARPNDTLRFMGVAVLSSAVAPTVGISILCMGGFSQWATFANTWWISYLGDMTGVIVVTPLILIWSKQTQFTWHARRFIEAMLFLVVLFTTCLAVFRVHPPTTILYYPRAYALIPLLIWAAFRFGQKGVTLLIVLVSGMAVWATFNGFLSFGAATRNESLVVRLILVDILTVTGLVLTAAVREGKEIAEKFRLVFDSAPNAMIMVGDSGTIVLVNSQAEKLFGYTREELIGRPVEVLVPPHSHSQHSTYHTGPFTQLQGRPMGPGRDLYAVRKDGSEFPVEIGLNPIETGEGTLVLSAIADITERKRTENQLRAGLEQKEVFMQEIHHRVKNNLQIISSLLNIQSRRIKDKQALRTFTDSQSRIESMALIHEILCHSKDVSKIDFARYVRELSQHLVASYRTDMRDTQIEVDVNDIWLNVDKAVPLGLLLTELVSNSLIHGFPPGRKGTIRVGLRPIEDGNFVLTLSDDGVGFPATVDFHNPYSIGLQLVNKLAEQLHGAIEFHPNGGTEFKLVFHQ